MVSAQGDFTHTDLIGTFHWRHLEQFHRIIKALRQGAR